MVGSIFGSNIFSQVGSSSAFTNTDPQDCNLVTSLICSYRQGKKRTWHLVLRILLIGLPCARMAWNRKFDICKALVYIDKETQKIGDSNNIKYCKNINLRRLLVYDLWVLRGPVDVGSKDRAPVSYACSKRKNPNLNPKRKYFKNVSNWVHLVYHKKFYRNNSRIG